MQLLEYEIIVLPFKNSFLRLRKMNPTGREFFLALEKNESNWESTRGVYAPSISISLPE